ncbi:peptidase M14 [Rhizocola hellebori]|uniref:Zinc carboxypeptidase n=1 Tax=Rhizocola hellebori TaxID=1392758 RepID=A0A8J3Q5X2_9ACTN|nr:M14 family zinc carboxypeptidase [Rhizocola hellebori]GIH03994.1 peptidase M14 [Rhizocola hellebori]
MSRNRYAVAFTTATALLAAALLLSPASGSSVTAAGPVAKGPTYVYRVNAPLGAATEKLLALDLDVLEGRDGQDLFVMGDRIAGNKMRAAGFPAVIEQVLETPQWTPVARRWQADEPTLLTEGFNALAEETFYGGYRTVNAQYAHLAAVAAARPDLATVYTYGQSWRKTQNRGGYDLRVICITKISSGDCARSTSAPKPRFLLMAQIHARELTTGDVAYRWIDYLVNNYGVVPAVTNLLNTTELWVIPIANPDGVDIVQQGGNSPFLQRKNGDDVGGTNCGLTGSSQSGVDLNRNAGSHYGGASTSTNRCAQTYRGTAADSETETRALEALQRSLFADTRGTGDTAAASANTKGIFVTLHSYANLVLFPWGFSNSVRTGNDAKLRAMATQIRTLAGSGWQSGQPGDVLYNASGTSDDWIYDQLGTPSFTWEIGPNSGSCSGFLPAYSCQTSTFWPKLQPMLMYAAGKAAAPYA